MDSMRAVMSMLPDPSNTDHLTRASGTSHLAGTDSPMRVDYPSSVGRPMEADRPARVGSSMDPWNDDTQVKADYTMRTDHPVRTGRPMEADRPARADQPTTEPQHFESCISLFCMIFNACKVILLMMLCIINVAFSSFTEVYERCQNYFVGWATAIIMKQSITSANKASDRAVDKNAVDKAVIRRAAVYAPTVSNASVKDVLQRTVAQTAAQTAVQEATRTAALQAAVNQVSALQAAVDKAVAVQVAALQAAATTAAVQAAVPSATAISHAVPTTAAKLAVKREVTADSLAARQLAYNKRQFQKMNTH